MKDGAETVPHPFVPSEDGRHLNTSGVKVVNDTPGSLEMEPVENCLQGEEEDIGCKDEIKLNILDN